MTQAALRTAPSGGVPAGYRKKIAGDVGAGAAKHAAGILFVAPDGDVLLLRRSNAEANYAGHWALPGGGADDGETPEQAARREAIEETGNELFLEGGPLKALDRRMTPTGTAFHTFAQPVVDKFVPKLNGEHSGYAWASLDMLPRPLHPAVEQTLQEQVGTAADMAPDDWKGIREGLLKWIAEEEAEAEHVDVATDSALTLALDRDSVREIDPEGRMRVRVAHISKATVNPYWGREIPNSEALGLEPDKKYFLLRDPEELRKAAATFNGVQLLRKHVPISAEDHQPYDVVGSTGTDAVFNDPYLDVSLSVWARDAIDGIETEAQRELSSGYRYRADMTPGIFNGMRYDGVMRDIVGNHVALVKDGRAGPDVVVGDSSEGITMSNDALARKINAIAHRQTTVGALVTYIKPRLAMDAEFSVAKILDGVPVGPKFKAMRSTIVQRITAEAKGKMAKDASLDDVEKVLDILDKHEVGSQATDEPITEPEHKAMEHAAKGQKAIDDVIPEVMDPAAGGGGNAALRAFLAEQGLSEEIITAALAKIAKTGMDAEEDDDAEAKKKAEQERKDKEAKDAAMNEKDKVTKPAMDAAIKAAVEATGKSVRESERGIRIALDAVRPYVGELPATLAFDSAEQVYRHALVTLGVDGAKDIHASALPTILGMQRKPGARAVEREPKLGMDAGAISNFEKRYPGAANIKPL